MERTFVARPFALFLILMYVCYTHFPALVLNPPLSVVPITTAGRMAVTVIPAIGIVRNALPPTVANVRAPRHPVARFMIVDQGPPHVGRTKSVGPLATREERNDVPRRNLSLVRPATTAAGTIGSGKKRMTDMKTALPGTLTAMRDSGKLTQTSYLKKFIGISPFILAKSDYFGDVYMYQTPCGLPISPCYPFHGPALS
jgi:hypothetical protein